MPRDFSRTLRVAEQVQRELADLIRSEIKDPRVGMVTLTGVEVAADYGHAKVGGGAKQLRRIFAQGVGAAHQVADDAAVAFSLR